MQISKTLVVAVVVGVGCAAQEIPASNECFGLQDCGDEALCFLGQCVDLLSADQELALVVEPPTASGLQAHEILPTLALSSGFQTIELRESIEVRGAVRFESGGLVDGTLIARVPAEASCNLSATQRSLTYSSIRSTDGFVLRVPSGAYQLSFLPTDPALLPPLDFTPDSPCGIELTDNNMLELDYPDSVGLTVVTGRLRASEDVTTGGVEGASVSAESLSSSGYRIRSTTVLTDSNGEFSLLFPENVTDVDLSVGPGAQELVPVVTFVGLVPLDGALEPQILGLEAPVALVPNLVGAELPDSDDTLSDVRIVLTGEVGPGILSLSIDTTNTQGRVLVRPGSYTLVVVPRQSQPFALSSASVVVPAGEAEVSVSIDVGLRTTVSGTVTSGLGRVVEAARVAFRSRESPVSREFATSTNELGRYTIDVDPSIHGNEAEYEVIVEPPRESGQPSLRQLVTIGSDGGELELRLPNQGFAFGELRSSDGQPVADTLLTFYSANVFFDGLPLFVGSTLADSRGEFALPVPILENP